MEWGGIMTLYITTRKTEHRGDGSRKIFAFDFPVFERDEIFVYILEDGETETTERTDFNVTGLGEEEGGYITFTGAAPTTTQVVHIQRWVENTQETNYVENDPFPADAHEDTLDRVVMMIQQTLQFEGVGEPGAFLMWDEHGDKLINGPDYADDIANAGAHAEEATASWLAALEAAMAARNFAGGALNTTFTYNGVSSKSAYHWATVAMVYSMFELNTICWFGNKVAPLGWTLENYSDCLIGVRSTTAGTTYYVDTNPWTLENPADSPKHWRASAIDADGSFHIVAAYGGRVHISQDYGDNWSEVQPAENNNLNWQAVACNSDGTKLIACVYNGRLYTSANAGANWEERRPDGTSNKNWRCLASSSNGNVLYAGIYEAGTGKSGFIWRSTDSGENWTKLTPKSSTAGNWKDVACSSDGTKVVAVEFGGKLYVSTDSGANWSVPASVNYNTNWNAVSCNSDGSVMTGVVSGSYVYVSTDYGATWDYKTSSGARSWYDISIDGSGNVIIACVYNGRVYQSSNAGVSWVEIYPYGSAINRYWHTCAISTTGAHMNCGISDLSTGYVAVTRVLSGAAGGAGTWSQNTHNHTVPAHSHPVGSITVSLPEHQHIWHLEDGNSSTYDVDGNVIKIGNYKSSKTTTGLINEVTKANSRRADATFYTNKASSSGGSASGSTANSSVLNSSSTATISTWRPYACLGIVAKLTTLPVATGEG
jgi:photosystem II stability/assembly factor-like uncharacterized protein